MTKQELLTDLAAKVHRVGTIQQVDASEGVVLYDVECFVQVGPHQIQRQTQPIYVEDEGTAEETAWYGQTERQNRPGTFRQRLQTAISTVEDSANVYRAIPERVNEERDFAIVRVYQDTNGDVDTELRFVWLDANANLQHLRYIGGVV